jgi:hypothetical protein
LNWAWAVIEQLENQAVHSKQHTDRILEVFDSGLVVMKLLNRRGLYWVDDLASDSEQIVGGVHDGTD